MIFATNTIERLQITASGSHIFTLPVTTGTGSTAGAQFLGNSLTTGNLIDASSTSVTTGALAKFTSTSTVLNDAVGTNARVVISLSGANSTSGKNAIAQYITVTNIGTSSTNYGLVIRTNGATVNNAIDLTGAILLNTSAGTSGQVLTSAGAGATPTWYDKVTHGVTAYLTLSAGTASANTAPLLFTSGTNLTSAVAGAMEYNGANLFFTRTGTTRQTVLTANVVTTEVVVSDTTVTVNIAGIDYKLLARA
jgi:hypothetical protein